MKQDDLYKAQLEEQRLTKLNELKEKTPYAQIIANMTVVVVAGCCTCLICVKTTTHLFFACIMPLRLTLSELGRRLQLFVQMLNLFKRAFPLLYAHHFCICIVHSSFECDDCKELNVHTICVHYSGNGIIS